MVIQNLHSNHCDKEIAQTNLLLVQLLLKTTDDKTKLTENPSLLSVIQSLSSSSELYFSRSTPLQRTQDNVVVSRAINDSDSSNCYSSISLPSSVHVTDVTHDKCHAYEHPACHGVLVTANETNVSNSIIVSEESEGLSCDSASSTSLPRKRSADMISILPTSLPLSKRVTQSIVTSNHAGEAISSLLDLENYIQGTKTFLKTVEESYNSIPRSATGKFMDHGYIQCLIYLFSYWFLDLSWH